jgi:hypothetical protein
MLDASEAFAGAEHMGHLSDLVKEFDPATFREIKMRALPSARGRQK